MNDKKPKLKEDFRSLEEHTDLRFNSLRSVHFSPDEISDADDFRTIDKTSPLNGSGTHYFASRVNTDATIQEQSINSEAITKQWLDQIASKTDGAYWVHLPPHNSNGLMLGVDRGKLLFAPSTRGRLVLDATFRANEAALTARIKRVCLGAITPRDYLLSEHAMMPLIPRELEAMSALLYRLIDQAAQLYGARGYALEFSKMDEIKGILQFDIETLGQPLVRDPAEVDLPWYDQLATQATEAWLFEPILGPKQMAFIKGSTRDPAQIRALQNMAAALQPHLQPNPSNRAVWVGSLSHRHWCILFEPEQTIILRINPQRLALLMSSIARKINPI